MRSLSKYNSNNMTPKAIAIMAALVLVLVIAIVKANSGHREPPEGFVELGTPYEEAKSMILAMYPYATVYEEPTGVSHAAIQVEVKDFEGVKGQTAKIHYIFSPETGELDLEYYWIAETDNSYTKIFNKWKKAVKGQYGNPEIEIGVVSPEYGNEHLFGFWSRGTEEVSLSTYEMTGEYKDETPPGYAFIYEQKQF